MWLEEYFHEITPSEEQLTSIKEYQAILKEKPNDEFSLNNLFTTLVNSRQIEEAHRVGQILLDHPYRDDVPSMVYHYWGEIEVHQKNFAEAIVLLQKSLDAPKCNNFGHINYKMGGCYAHLKNYEAAERCLLAAVNKHRSEDYHGHYHTCQFWDGLGMLYTAMERYEDAIEIFKERYVSFSEPEYAWYTGYCIAKCYQSLGDDLRAMEYYYKVLAVEPNVPEVYNNLAAIAMNEHGNIAEAIEFAEKALTMVEDGDELRGTICINLARLNNKIANYEKAEYYKDEFMKDLGFPVGWEQMLEEDDEKEEDQDDEEGMAI